MGDYKCNGSCTTACNCSQNERFLWPQFDALQLAIGWTESDIQKKQVLVGTSWETAIPEVRIWAVSQNRYRSASMRAAENRAGSIPRISVMDVPKGMME